jgi:hypothetical protein
MLAMFERRVVDSERKGLGQLWRENRRLWMERKP